MMISLLYVCLQLLISLQHGYSITAPAKCRPQDQSALLIFRKTFFWTPNAFENCVTYEWDKSVDCCLWFGVTCETSTGNVIGVRVARCRGATPSTLSANSSLFHLSFLRYLDLSYLDRQQSTIPAELGNLSHLRTLDLRGCNLTGPIPAAVGNLDQLRLLVLSQNRLTGTIPEAIGKLTKIQHLDLSLNAFSGSIPSIGNLKELQILEMESCGLSGAIPSALADLPKLQVVSFKINLLTGTIPFELFYHPNLSWISFSSNKLGGSLPPAIPKPSNLTFIDLSNNKLQGNIPPWLFAIPSLSYLSLRNNNLGSFEPFPRPSETSLEDLDLSFSEIGGRFPPSLLQLVNLRWLKLEATELTGVLEWSTLKDLVNLISLDLSQNSGLNLRNTHEPPLNLPFFRDLYFSSCNLTEFPNFLSKFDSIEYLDVSGNKLSGALSMQGGWTQLYMFNGSHNRITSFDFPNSTRISEFDLSNNLLGGALPPPPVTLDILLLSNNHLSGELPNQLCNISFGNILDLSNNDLGGMLLPCPMNIGYLRGVLNLEKNHFVGVIPDTFNCDFFEGSLYLSFVMLNDNNLEGPLPKSLTNCRHLEVLDVGNNKITDVFPSGLAQLPDLQILILRSNHFYGSVEGQFKNLQILDASFNNFSGSIPASFIQNLQYMKSLPTMVDFVAGALYYGGLSQQYRFYVSVDVTVKGVKLERRAVLNTLTILDFSNNHFSGAIPLNIGSLKALKVLSLSHNNFSGEIPSSVGSMKELESFDLSRNSLRGLIPPSMKKLENLEFLNMSYNNLRGPIPLSKFSNASYIGNPTLCGHPLSISC